MGHILNKFQLVALAILMLTACDVHENNMILMEDASSIVLPINVSLKGFHSEVGVTRVVDDGNLTQFQKGDCLGVIVLAESGEVLADNIPYQYDGSAWKFDKVTADKEGKSPYYYDNKSSELSYLAYFPYHPDANGLTTTAGFKSRFHPLSDQRKKSDYVASDLLLWESGKVSPQKLLDIRLEHACSVIALLPSIQFNTLTGHTERSIVSVDNVSLTIGGETCYAYRAKDGSSRFIVPPGAAVSSRWFYMYREAVYQVQMPEIVPVANTRYNLLPILSVGNYDWSKMRKGDFYCMNGDGDPFLLPAESLSFPDGVKIIGSVFYVGGQPFTDDQLLRERHPGCTHGLVVAFQEPSPDYWLSGSSDPPSIERTWLNVDGNPYKDKVNLSANDKMCGYSNTLALSDYNAGLYGSPAIENPRLKVKPCVYVKEYVTSYPVPAGSSGWYVPAGKELLCMYHEKDLLNSQFAKINGARKFTNVHYWTSTEAGLIQVYVVNFDDGSAGDFSKYLSRVPVRFILAI